MGACGSQQHGADGEENGAGAGEVKNDKPVQQQNGEVKQEQTKTNGNTNASTAAATATITTASSPTPATASPPVSNDAVSAAQATNGKTHTSNPSNGATSATATAAAKPADSTGAAIELDQIVVQPEQQQPSTATTATAASASSSSHPASIQTNHLALPEDGMTHTAGLSHSIAASPNMSPHAPPPTPDVQMALPRSQSALQTDSFALASSSGSAALPPRPSSARPPSLHQLQLGSGPSSMPTTPQHTLSLPRGAISSRSTSTNTSQPNSPPPLAIIDDPLDEDTAADGDEISDQIIQVRPVIAGEARNDAQEEAAEEERLSRTPSRRPSWMAHHNHTKSLLQSPTPPMYLPIVDKNPLQSPLGPGASRRTSSAGIPLAFEFELSPSHTQHQHPTQPGELEADESVPIPPSESFNDADLLKNPLQSPQIKIRKKSVMQGGASVPPTIDPI